MKLSAISKKYKILGAAVALSVVAVPVIVQADSSNPVYAPKKKKAAVKQRAKKKSVARRAVERAPRVVEVAEQRVESIAPPAPQPEYIPPPPAPEVMAPAAEVAQAPVEAAPVAKSGGNGLLVGLLGAAAVVGGILLATGGDNPASGG
jgi:hypothetical protein